MLTVNAVLAAVVSAWANLPFLVAFVIAVLATIANGLLATLEDDLPGGFSNPDGTDTPPYVKRLRRTVWSAVFVLLLATGLAWVVLSGSATRSRLLAAGFAAMLIVALFALWRKR